MLKFILRDRGLLMPELREHEIDAIRLGAAPNLVSYVGVIVLANVAPTVTAGGFTLISIVGVARVRGDRITQSDDPRI